ncbi:hypothetical protein MMC31_000419 [Peltigera leucophlebia]|nr:hypothetical protein [Peltigera leucophlebia]
MTSDTISNAVAENATTRAGNQTDASHRPPRTNYKQLHALPLPLQTFPLPPLIPHNPFSVFRIVFAYLYQLIALPLSHPQPPFKAFISPETRTVHVTNEQTIRKLWERGFFGKGSLSRSEPSWLDRERRRAGLDFSETSEEVTKRRREERRKFKKERAWKETQAVEEKLKEEAENLVIGNANANEIIENSQHGNADFASSIGPIGQSSSFVSGTSFSVPSNTMINPKVCKAEGLSLENDTARKPPTSLPDGPIYSDAKRKIDGDRTIIDQEHLQLTAEEAFFLVYGLGVLKITTQDAQTAVSTASLFSFFRQNSYFPPRSPSDVRPDDPFLLSYVVYHHFRSLGWVVRSGIKFGVDWLLYNRGPVFSHAEFAVFILPSYRHPYWHSTTELTESNNKVRRSWWWLHCVNRVQNQVRKSLLLVYVEVPPPVDVQVSVENLKSKTGPAFESDMEITHLLKQYKLRELTIRRWTPNRSRQ